MILAKVVGTVVATRKDPRLVSSKLLVVRAVDPHAEALPPADGLDLVRFTVDDEVEPHGFLQAAPAVP